MRTSHKIIYAVFGIAGLMAAGIVALVTIPQISETALEWSCPQEDPNPSQDCIVRMRAMGSVWLAKDNLERAEVWYGRAAGKNDVVAIRWMGHISSFKHDFSRAEDWYQQAANAGDIESWFHLGWLYEQTGLAEIIDDAKRLAESDLSAGPVPNFNMTRAEDAYLKAAGQNFAPAMNNLGELYGTGALGSGLQETRFGWVLRSAEAGNPAAAMNVAIAYLSGRGVTRDPDAAKRWSVWTSEKTDRRDLREPTFGRTTVFGNEVPAGVRVLIRQAAKDGKPFAVEPKPLPSNPQLPTFRSVRDQISH
jgi:hypothetical protein